MITLCNFKDVDEWRANRFRIGGSDAPIVLGISPFKKNVELWEEKIGLKKPADISENAFVKYGTEAEKPIRELFKLDFPQYQVGYSEFNMFLNTEYPFAHASLDGWLLDKKGRIGVLEVKTANITNKMQALKWGSELREDYRTQLLHNMIVCGADFGILVAQLKYGEGESLRKETKHYFIERKNFEREIKNLIETEANFWQCILSKKQPSTKLPRI